ncbi:ribosomal protein S18-alanine N-acetyltransferase [Candidatus Endoriftia persephone]|uniref:[Ribosomal protein bS18]-alanine N-acetyltransferase n=3 Tax=Gammaproteobacteria TaxID=1236 RepID=G2FFN3_9GAMM|nr:ribosomal protein S18-alanine N-acetyltransferase [Candidatus Endoriftia persephone]EGV52224.1 putative acetyltransferase [endosymbiont of Riftia pachyptila (vent Ph05)]EGW54449.1 ribosomal-protein-S18p-alanine acetyltransferase [endosymbiont of Tevnia jerichonana (vent Tica)]USF87179.1 ribosomal protein S18-alanine N-acetyltransferase [Candidatus Endoriftia persephone]
MSTQLQDPLLDLRPMQAEDLEQVLQIEQRVYPFPWTLGILRDCLKVGYCCWVVTVDQQIVGYGVMSVVVDECHLLNICIDPGWQRLGLGRRLVERLLQLGRQHGAEAAYLEVRESNRPAHRLYRQIGFVEVGRRRDYYPAIGGREDALLLTLSF